MKKIVLVLLSFCLVLPLSACGSGGQAPETSTPTDTPLPTASPTPESSYLPTAAPTEPEPEPELQTEPDSELPINIMVLNGATGFGMAKLASDAITGAAAFNYTVSVETDASVVTAALINGDTDIAALPTNAAAVVYNRTGGGVQLAALNTRGVLYVVVNPEEETVESMADLAGKTVYAPAQNPTFIYNYIAQANGIEEEADNSYAQPADLRTALTEGLVDIAVLPEPMVTMALLANESLAVAIDLTEEWDNVAPVTGSLVQGCVVVRTDFAEEHPLELAAFLDEYGASIAYLTENPEEAAQLIVDTGIFANAAVAQRAIPNCNVCFVTGEEMRTEMEEFLNIMLDVAPQSIGGALPGTDFYYIAP